MAEDKKTEPSTRKPAPVSPAAALLPAAQSSDPAVHQVLAEIQTARANGDDDQATALTKRLAELGYE